VCLDHIVFYLHCHVCQHFPQFIHQLGLLEFKGLLDLQKPSGSGVEVTEWSTNKQHTLSSTKWTLLTGLIQACRGFSQRCQQLFDCLGILCFRLQTDSLFEIDTSDRCPNLKSCIHVGQMPQHLHFFCVLATASEHSNSQATVVLSGVEGSAQALCVVLGGLVQLIAVGQNCAARLPGFLAKSRCRASCHMTIVLVVFDDIQSDCPWHHHVPLRHGVDFFRVVIIRIVEAREIYQRDIGLLRPRTLTKTV
jgi:hypothetical protein